MNKTARCFHHFLVLALLGIVFVTPSISQGSCSKEEIILQYEYLGACGHTQTTSFTLAEEAYITRIRIWYDTSVGGNTISATLSGPDGYSKASSEIPKGACNSTWCEAIWNLDQVLKAGAYTLATNSNSVCSNPSGQTTLILYGCANSTPIAAPALTVTTSGTTVSLSWASVAGASGYTLYYAPYPKASPIGSISMGNKTSISSTLPDGAAFYVAVQAHGSAGSSGYSNIEHFIIQQVNIITGEATQVAEKTISPSGGTITVSGSGTPLDGMKITVPDGAYEKDKTFNISYAPITSATGNSHLKPITGLITIENGGGEADQMMLIEVPVSVPDDEFAMGFYYDSTNRTFEGLLLNDIGSDTVTLATRHFGLSAASPSYGGIKADGVGGLFSKVQILISSIKEDELFNQYISSGFRPGVDDWEFPNKGSYIAPDGNCVGQSMAMMYYYSERKAQGGQLNGKYDRLRNFWQDNPEGYRLCSMNQFDYTTERQEAMFRDYFLSIVTKWKYIYMSFAYSILLTGEPQYLTLDRDVSSHAVVAYQVYNGTIFVCDPNSQGNLGKVIFYDKVSDTFLPYEGAQIAGGPGYFYRHIYYAAKTAIISWESQIKRWQQFDAGTIGDDTFPQYTIKINGEELTDNYVSKKENVTFSIPFNFPAALKMQVVDSSGNFIFDTDDSDPEPVQLSIGENKFGFLILGDVAGAWKYVDFEWLTINFAITVPNVVGETQDAAASLITQSGLIVGTVTEEFDAAVPKGQVISQNPAAGTKVEPGSTVNVVVSKGPDPGGSISGTYPPDSPSNGLQVDFNFSGGAADGPPEYGWRYTGTLGSGTMAISGKARMEMGYSADLTVELWAGNERSTFTVNIPKGTEEAFDLSVPIPVEAGYGGFRIRLSGNYSMGGGGIMVEGYFYVYTPETQ